MSNLYGVDQAMAILQEKALVNEIDYNFVLDSLKNYDSPRAKITRLIDSEALIHLRKGLYLLGKKFQHTPYCLELAANLIYGPSYVSLERALQIYGLIPEHVETITSVTFKEKKEFRSSIGVFQYAHCHPKIYSVGITTRSYSKYENPLIATKEKALVDLLMIRKGKITSLRQLEQILIEDLRMEEDDLRLFDLKLIQQIKEAHPHSATLFLEKWLLNLKRESR